MSYNVLELIRSKGSLPARYGNYIGGKWIAPVDGEYFTDYSPINGDHLVDVVKSTARDVKTALDQGAGRLCPLRLQQG
jgi:aldehyde dehydrogenase